MLADLDGRTGVEGLFAVGEVACTGVQGANRLASNSVTEGLVAARRCATLLAAALPDARAATGRRPHRPAPSTRPPAATITTATTAHAGVLRDGDGLAALATALVGAAPLRPARWTWPRSRRRRCTRSRPWSRSAPRPAPRAAAATAAPTPPDTRPEWQVRLVHRIDPSGRVHTRTTPVRTGACAAGGRMTAAFRAEVLDALRAGGLDPADVLRVVRGALDEDLSFGPDVTTLSTVPADSRATGDVVPRTAGVLAGVPVAAAVFDVVGGADVEITLLAADGERRRAGRAVLSVTGPTRALLTAERTALNLIGRLSGIATLTRRWVDEVEGTTATIRDTRKTTPGLRLLEKYAVRCGGGQNHRMALGDAALVKDNHVAAAGGIAAAVERVRATAPDVPLEVECDTLDQVREAVAAGRRAGAAGQLLAGRHPHGGRRSSAAPACGSRPAAGCRWTGRARSRPPASTTWPSAR